jgi:uncharacterized phage protein (TIGR01671 family)
MREIKFRAWQNGGMLSVGEDIHLFPTEDGTWYAITDVDTDERFDGIVMQYTGLKDKNGVEIYEGDILSLFDPRPQVEHKRKVSAVTFANGAFLVDTQMGSLPDRKTLETVYEHFEWREYSDCEVIGNVYESPELLDKTS